MPRQSKPKPWCVVWLPDLHAGSSVAVCPPTVELDDGAIWHASPGQTWLYRNLQNFYARIKEEAHKYRIAAVIGGDTVDGAIHHGSLQTFGSRRIQEQLAVELLLPLANMADELYGVRGTSGHTGAMADSDYRVCRELGAADCYWNLDLEIDGILANFRHHTTSSRRAWTRGDSLRRLMRDLYYQAKEADVAPPNMIFRGHVHLSDYETLPRWNMQGAVSGAWKLADEFVATLPLSLCSTGGVLAWPLERRMELVEYHPVRKVVKAGSQRKKIS